MSNKFQCIMYLFSGSKNGLQKLNFDVVTHVNYAFAIPTKDGHVLPLNNPELAKELIEKAHAAGAKVSLSLGGWSYQEIPLEETFYVGTNTPEKIHSMAHELVDMAASFGFDGVDVDWEYPRTYGGSKEQFEALIGLLRELVDEKGMMLTTAVFGGVDSRNKAIPSACDAQDRPSFDKLDYMNLMTYDCDGPKHSTYEFAENCIRYWVEQRGFEPEKLTLGLPFYGRPAPGNFNDLLALDPDALDKDMVVVDGKEVWDNGRETLTKKVALAKRWGLGGIMVWEVSEDADDYEQSLTKVLGDAMKNA